MTRSFQAPERIGARELELAELERKGAEFGQAVQPIIEAGNAIIARAKGTTDHDGDGKMGGVKGRKPKAKK